MPFRRTRRSASCLEGASSTAGWSWPIRGSTLAPRAPHRRKGPHGCATHRRRARDRRRLAGARNRRSTSSSRSTPRSRFRGRIHATICCRPGTREQRRRRRPRRGQDRARRPRGQRAFLLERMRRVAAQAHCVRVELRAHGSDKHGAVADAVEDDVRLARLQSRVVDVSRGNARIGEDRPERNGERRVDDHGELQASPIHCDADLVARHFVAPRALQPARIDRDRRRHAKSRAIVLVLQQKRVRGWLLAPRVAGTSRDGHAQGVAGERARDVHKLEAVPVAQRNDVHVGVCAPVDGGSILEDDARRGSTLQLHDRTCLSALVAELERSGRRRRRYRHDLRAVCGRPIAFQVGA